MVFGMTDGGLRSCQGTLSEGVDTLFEGMGRVRARFVHGGHACAQCLAGNLKNAVTDCLVRFWTFPAFEPDNSRRLAGLGALI